MHIACLGNNWFPESASGLERYLDAIARELTQAGDEVDLFVTGRPTPWDEHAHTYALAAPGASLVRRMVGAGRTLRQHARKQYDVVNIHFALHGWQMLRTVPPSAARVITFHGPWCDESRAEAKSKLRTSLMYAIETSTYRAGDRFIVLSGAFRDILESRYGIERSRISVIPGGADLARFTTDLDRRSARRRLGWPESGTIAFVARRFVRRTGIVELIQTAAILRERAVPVQIMVAGSGYLEPRIRAQIDALRLGTTVRLLGYVAHEGDLPIAYRAADLTIVPTQELEGFGLTVAESLACGTPTLVTPVGGLPEVVEGLPAQIVMGGKEPAAMATAIESAVLGHVTMPSEADCRAFALRNFAWPVIAERVRAVFTQAQEDARRRDFRYTQGCLKIIN